MKNITVSVDDEVYHNARVYAAQHKTSVSKMVQEQLAKLSSRESEFERLHRLQNELFERFDRERKNGPHFLAAERMSREELYDRDKQRKEDQAALLAQVEPDEIR